MGARIRTVLSQKGAGRRQRKLPLSSRAGRSLSVDPSVMNSPDQRPEDEILADICLFQGQGRF